MPLVSRTFDQLIDFTRTSAATYVDATGKIVPTPASRNLLTFTQEIDNAVWTKLNTVVATTNAAAAPDGTLTAELVRETAVIAVAYAASQTHSYNAGTNYTLSAYLKKGSGATAPDWVQLTFGSAAFGASQYANFNLATGAVGTVVGGFSAIQNVGNGWYRVSFTATATTTASAASGVIFCNNSNTSGRVPLYNGATTSDVFIWGAQLEAVPDANLVLGSELRGGGVVSTAGSPSPLATYNTTTGEATLNRVDGSNVSGVRIPVGGAGRTIRVSVTITATTGTVQVRGNGIAGTILGTVGSTAGTYLLYVVSDTADIYLTMSSNATTASITVNSIREITGTTGMPTDYTRNVGGVYPPRFDYDPVTLAPKGLLIEEQRTNLLVRSEQFDNAAWVKNGATVTANATTSPDGTVDADALIESTNTGAHQVSALPGAGINTYTFSFYAKANGRTQVQVEQESGGNSNFTLSGSGTATALGANTVSITPLSNGWYRCTTTFTVTGAFGIYIKLYNGSTSYTGDGTSGIYIWGAQLEAGSFATSYIPTVASQVTRTADVATITGANFSQWYNQSEGTVVVSSVYSVSGDYASFGATDGTTNNRIFSNISGGGFNARVVTGGVLQAGLDLGIAVGSTQKVAIAYQTDNFAASRNGEAAVTDNSGTVPVVSRMTIGSMNGVSIINGYIRSIRYYPTRLTDAQLQALTA